MEVTAVEDKIPPETVVIDWRPGWRRITFLSTARQVVEVCFKPVEQGTDTFLFCCSIAIAQELCADKDGLTKWASVSARFAEAITEKLGRRWRLSTLKTYWANFVRGQHCERHQTRITVDGQDLAKGCDVALELFWRRDGIALGTPGPLIEGRCQLWPSKFIGCGLSLDDLRRTVQNTLEGLGIPIQSPEVLPPQTDVVPEEGGKDSVVATRMSNIVHGVKDTPYELGHLLTGDWRSCFIVGQNLYTLVRDEVEAAHKGVELEGRFRGALKTWLKQGDERQADILLCDPRSKESVIHYAGVFGPAFITHLCDAMPRYQLWQKAMAEIGLDVWVTDTVPLSFVAVESAIQDAKDGVMMVTAMAFEPRSSVRPPLFV